MACATYGEEATTHDVEALVVEVLEERGGSPAVANDDKRRKFRIVRELLARVSCHL